MKFLRCLAVMAIVLTSSTVHAASIKTQFILLAGTSGSTVINPVSPGVYDILPGTVFRVRLTAQVISPNLTDNQRQDQNGDPIFTNVPLGIFNLNGQVVSNEISGANMIKAVANNAFTPPRWNGFSSATGTPSFANLIDVGNDGDLDPSGAGAARTDLSLDEVDPLSNFQLGASASATIFTGQYEALLGSLGTTQLSFIAQTAQVYGDDPNNPDTNAVFVHNVTVVSTPITFSLVPEPSTYALAGMGLVGLAVAYRRRKTYQFN